MKAKNLFITSDDLNFQPKFLWKSTLKNLWNELYWKIVIDNGSTFCFCLKKLYDDKKGRKY